MEPIISKEELDELTAINGEVRGISLKRYKEYVVKEEGEEGLKKLEDTMKSLGHPINFKEIGSVIFYPISLEAIVLLAIQRLFQLKDEDLQEIGKLQAKTPMVIRLFTKYILSFEKAAESARKIWRTYYTVGDLRTIEYDNKEKNFAIVRLENFHHHPFHCQIVKGYILSMLAMIVGSKVKSCEETKCLYKGDDYHEFLIKW